MGDDSFNYKLKELRHVLQRIKLPGISNYLPEASVTKQGEMSGLCRTDIPLNLIPF